jgi:hypothetical protein
VLMEDIGSDLSIIWMHIHPELVYM